MIVSQTTPYQSSLSLLITLFMSDYDTCVFFYNGNRSNEYNDFEDLLKSLLSHYEKSVISFHMRDSRNDHILRTINKNHLNVYNLNIVDTEVIHQVERIYNQSNQYDVWNLIFIHDGENVDHLIDCISKQSNIISSTTLVTLIEDHLSIWNENFESWTELTTTTSALNIPKETFKKHINLHGQGIIVSFETHPITNFIFRVLKQPLYIGVDAFIGVEIYQHLNAEPIYSNYRVEILRQTKELEPRIGTLDEVRQQIETYRRMRQYISPHLDLIFDLKKLDKILINLNSVVNRKADINMSPSLVRNTNEMDFLYPHDQECIMLMIPRAESGLSFIAKTMTSNEMITFEIAVIIFFAIRLVVLQLPIRKWPSLLIDTHGFYLAQISISPKNSVDKLLLLSIMITSIQILSVLSGLFFANIIDGNNRKSINTVSELVESDLKIIMLDQHYNTTVVEDWILHVSPLLLNRTEFLEFHIFSDIFSRNPSKYAFGLPANLAPFMNRLYDIQQTFYYIMKENLYCSQTSYHITRNSPMTQKVNGVIQEMVENGLIRVYNRLSMNAFMRVFEHVLTKFIHADSLNMEQIAGAIYIYACGVLICFIIFVLENIIYTLNSNAICCKF